MAKKEDKQMTSESLGGQPCPMCRKNTLTLTEAQDEIPYFGKVFLFSMKCDSCKYYKSDVEAEEKKEPCKYTFEIQSKNDLNVRVVKSSEATVKIPFVGDIMPGAASEGYVTNVEGIINKIKEQVEILRDTEEDTGLKNKAKNILKKIMKILWGEEKAKIIIIDPTGNSAIISDKTVKSK